VSRRHAAISRETTETRIRLSFTIDGAGDATVATGVGAFDHFLTLFARHGLFDLNVEACGDLDIDPHHTVEDVAICLGQAVRDALGDHRGIVRVGQATVPMDEALATVAVDCGGRSYFVQNGRFSQPSVGTLATDLVRHFFDTLSREARINIHIVTLYGSNAHHEVEAIFKAFGRALDAATTMDPRLAGRLPSTKERIEGSI
jgi:imidazoleglycerol-phosphate dehydratase